MYERCTYDEVLSALNFVNPNMCRDEWAQVGMAIKNEFGSEGWDLFDRWSQGGESYKHKDCLSTWKSVKTYGSKSTITIAHVFRLAIDAGYTPEKKQLSAAEQKKRDAEYAQRKAKREAEALAQQKHDTAWDAVVAEAAREVWGVLVEQGKSDYIKNKQIRGFGVRFAKAGMVLLLEEASYSYKIITGRQAITEFFKNKTEETKFNYFKPGVIVLPLLNEAGELFNLQLIHAAGGKCYLPGIKSGLFSWLAPVPPENTQPIIIGEGYSTVASAHMATQWPAVVAFDSGNLPKVATTIRTLYPDAKILIVGDDDIETEENAGRTKAMQAAAAVGACVVFPDFGDLINAECEQHAA